MSEEKNQVNSGKEAISPQESGAPKKEVTVDNSPLSFKKDVPANKATKAPQEMTSPEKKEKETKSKQEAQTEQQPPKEQQQKAETESAKDENTLNGVKRNKYADKMNKTKKKKLSKKTRIIIGAVIALAVIAACIFLIVNSKGKKDDTGSSTAFVTYGAIETSIEGDGTTSARTREELGKDVKGVIKKVYIEVGDEVKSGDKLIDIDPTDTKKELDAAEDDLKDAKSAVTDAQRGVNEAQSALNAAQNSGSSTSKKTSITAPFTGTIISAGQSYSVGSDIDEGDVIGYMVDGTMKLSVNFNSMYDGDIEEGQSASVSSSSGSASGTVSSVGAVQGSGLFKVTITISSAGSLSDGASASATVSSYSGQVNSADSGTLSYDRKQAVVCGVSGTVSANNGLNNKQYNSGSTILQVTTTSGGSSSGDVQSAQSALTAAKSVLSSAQKNVTTKQAEVKKLEKAIEEANITATMDGVIVSVTAIEDEETSGGTLCVLADLDSMVVTAHISATDIYSVEVGQDAIMTMYTQDGEIQMTGVVESVAMEADKELSSGQGGIPIFPATISVDPVEGQILRPDYMVQYQIITESVSDCLVVPSSAIVNTADGTAVFAKPLEGSSFDYAIPIPEGTEGIPKGFELVPVEVGISNSSLTEIYWGIEEGMEVYLAGPEDLYSEMEDMYVDDMAVAVG